MFRFDQNRTERKTRSRSWFELSHCGLQADYNVAYLHYLQGDYHRAIELMRQRESFARASATPTPRHYVILPISDIAGVLTILLLAFMTTSSHQRQENGPEGR